MAYSQAIYFLSPHLQMGHDNIASLLLQYACLSWYLAHSRYSAKAGPSPHSIVIIWPHLNPGAFTLQLEPTGLHTSSTHKLGSASSLLPGCYLLLIFLSFPLDYLDLTRVWSSIFPIL